ncbi:MAG: 50S ribosomal protein L23 [Candidatus Parcubacteria bacterium]|nr:50S ribosomal protein L23 [Candidatus Parcubacteria bacterium]
MGFFDKFKKKLATKSKEEKKDKAKKTSPVKVAESKEIRKKEVTKYTSLKAKTEGTSPVKDIKEKKAKKDETKDAYRILLKPLVTEKATDLVSQNKYSFIVAKQANKIEIKKAIKALYGLKPLAVNIVYMRGKIVQYGHASGKKKNWKKAVITLKAGDKIEIYEGV